MIPNNQKDIILKEMLELLELPPSAYEKATDRYKDIGEELSKDESIIYNYEPHIYSQGSFRLGTAIKPLEQNEKYDLDLACELGFGKTKENSTQKEIKELIGLELENYRVKRGIQQKLKEKHRCWRLEYLDQLNFHIDIVPCIPAKEEKRKIIREAILNTGISESLSTSLADLTVNITDNTDRLNYNTITDEWKISNPRGYALWFESRMKQAPEYLRKRALLLEKANIDDLPTYQWKTPLQQSIQLLKRHRDFMYSKKSGKVENKPISIIITTLASRAYQGERNIADSIKNILLKMGELINNDIPRVPNPVNPNEDFADKWYDPKCKHLELEENFNLWLTSAIADFDLILTNENATQIKEQSNRKFGLELDEDLIKKTLRTLAPSIITQPKSYEIDLPVKPWLGI